MPLDIDDFDSGSDPDFDMDTVVTECRAIARAYDAATREGVGVLLVRGAHHQLVDAYVCDDVPAGEIREAVQAPDPRQRQRPRLDLRWTA